MTTAEPPLRTVAILRKNDGTPLGGTLLGAVAVSAMYTDEELMASLEPYGLTIDTEVYDADSGADPKIDATIRTYVDLLIWLDTSGWNASTP